MDEYIDIADINGKLIGKSELKSVIHQKGLYHHTAHIWFYTPNGEILLSQRSAKKVICPLMWDVSVAGHIDAGETIKSGAIREIQEEIGLTIKDVDLKPVGIFEAFQSYDNGIIDNEFYNTFISELKVDINKLTLQKEEVESIKLVSFSTFKNLLDKSDINNHFVASNRNYYLMILNKIKEII